MVKRIGYLSNAIEKGIRSKDESENVLRTTWIHSGLSSSEEMNLTISSCKRLSRGSESAVAVEMIRSRICVA